MSAKLDPQKFPIRVEPLEPIVERVALGNAILFVGAGFARNAINFANDAIPNADGLAKIIGQLGNFDPEGDLKYAADKFIRDNNPQLLVNHLHTLFSIREVLPHQISICKAPWRRIYTTNYDLTVERASALGGKQVDAIDLDATPSNYLSFRDVCVHLNGSTASLTSETLNTSFKLSASSYLSADSFLESSWNLPFRRDLEMCSAIVFVGYSLYDIEIQKILYGNSAFVDKTFFITSPSITERERFKLDPFGKCSPVGAEGFGECLDDLLPKLTVDAQTLQTISILPYAASSEDRSPRDADAEKFLMYGDIADDIFDNALLRPDGAPTLIRRDGLTHALEAVTSNRNIAVVGEFGNGKTIFLRSLRTLVT